MGKSSSNCCMITTIVGIIVAIIGIVLLGLYFGGYFTPDPEKEAAKLRDPTTEHNVALGCTDSVPLPEQFKVEGTDTLDKPIEGTTTSDHKVGRHNGSMYKYGPNKLGTVWVCANCIDTMKSPKHGAEYRTYLERELKRRDPRKNNHADAINSTCPMYDTNYPGFGPCRGRKDC